jgi:hypothetical protein
VSNWTRGAVSAWTQCLRMYLYLLAEGAGTTPALHLSMQPTNSITVTVTSEHGEVTSFVANYGGCSAASALASLIYLYDMFQ